MIDDTPNVPHFYDNNTRRFLRLGQNQRTRNIHQPLWTDKAQSLEEAVNQSNVLVLNEFRRVAEHFPNQHLQIVDLGCGVGSSLFYLGEHIKGDVSLTGISNSPLQVKLAKRFCAKESGGANCQFILGDYLNLPVLPTAHLAYAIESFLHAQSAKRFFESVAKTLAPKARLVIIDDFLTERGEHPSLPAKHEDWLADFRSGWLAGSLITEDAATTLASNSGLRFVESEDLTPQMKLGRPRDRVIGLMRTLAAPQMRRSTYFRALNGGYAKQQCLKHGLVQYRRLVFEAE
tara:strand:+ start:187010 stop:187876 length:867 start_codon:yes stop_codon:yes gene_type:complete